ncbi:E3 ubiquitin-protein ligase ZSWIM2 [Alligator mississippiensis]|uniref:E3 ubiquitin-protein ligase ZSWIM2 n=1 Tax=Alligator mississippiensis TaxID=8496 RepID=A0A151NA79_ALLMI|nr:E3 ubiquitin-protein ligase ZSWIM2 [Alligator mississippiensis]
MRIVRELGPTAFVLREERGPPQRVLLGAPHSCTCAAFRRERDLCAHLCWILLKKFKLPRNHEYAFQLGLLEREINDVLQRVHQEQSSSPKAKALSTETLEKEDDGYINQKEIDVEDVCPICQEELLKKMLPVTYCRYSCGNSVHITCMKIWADHQGELENESVVKCPLCREEFAPLKLIIEEFRNSSQLVTAAEKMRLDRHLGIPCNNCRVFPIQGKCYKCTVCVEYHLCHECYRKFCHPPHVFTFRQKRNQSWRSLKHVSQLSASRGNLKTINTRDEEEMLRLQKTNCIPEHIVKSIPYTLVRKCSNLLAPGLQCRLCLKIFCLGQYARLLPCNHKFHRKCIDDWLQHQKNACPVDGYIVYNPLTWKDVPANHDVHPSGSQTSLSKIAKHMEPELFVPGIGLFSKQTQFGRIFETSQVSLKQLHASKDPPDSQQDLNLNTLSYLHLGEPHSSQHSTNGNLTLQFSRHFKNVTLSTLQKTRTLKSYSVASRRDAHLSSIRDLNGSNADRGTEVCQVDYDNLNKATDVKGRNNQSSTSVRFPGNLNFKVNLGTINQRSSKGESKFAGISKPERLLAKLPKHNLSLKTEPVLLMEGFSLNNRS